MLRARSQQRLFGYRSQRTTTCARHSVRHAWGSHVSQRTRRTIQRVVARHVHTTYERAVHARFTLPLYNLGLYLSLTRWGCVHHRKPSTVWTHRLIIARPDRSWPMTSSAVHTDIFYIRCLMSHQWHHHYYHHQFIVFFIKSLHTQLATTYETQNKQNKPTKQCE